MNAFKEHYGKFGAVLGVGAIIGWVGLTQSFGYHGPGVQGEQKAKAQLEMAAAICEGQFRASPDAAAVFAELKAKNSSYNRGEIIEKGKWNIMPGSTTSLNYQVAPECADLIIEHGPPKQMAAEKSKT
jgi:hypothetical protein